MLGLLPDKREFFLPSITECLLMGGGWGVILLSGLSPERSSVFTLSYKVPLSPFVVIYCCINEPELN